MNQHEPTTAASTQEAMDLARRLKLLADTIEKARALGLPVGVPPTLLAACQHIVTLQLDASEPPTEPLTPGPDGRDAMHDVPLRRLVWKVIDPGETFTVTDVTERLRQLGVTWPTNKVSNALGYWVSRQRLQRESKGVYYYTPADEQDLQSVHSPADQGDTARAFQVHARGLDPREELIGAPPSRAKKAS